MISLLDRYRVPLHIDPYTRLAKKDDYTHQMLKMYSAIIATNGGNYTKKPTDWPQSQ